MSQILVDTHFKTKKTKMNMGEFMGMAMDYYNTLEDKMFGKILGESDTIDIVDYKNFRSALKGQINAQSGNQ